MRYIDASLTPSRSSPVNEEDDEVIIGRFIFPPLQEVFNHLLPALQEAAKGPNPVREVARLIHRHPEHKGVLLAYLAVTVARKTKNRELATRVLRKASQHLTDDYLGLLYGQWCGVAVVLACQTPESILYHQQLAADDGLRRGHERDG